MKPRYRFLDGAWVLVGMNLHDIYQEGGFAALRRLAEATGSDPQYLWQCATRWRGKQPSLRLARALIAADPRLTLDAIYAASAHPPKQAA